MQQHENVSLGGIKEKHDDSCMCVCVCVRGMERERKKNEKDKDKDSRTWNWQSKNERESKIDLRIERYIIKGKMRKRGRGVKS